MLEATLPRERLHRAIRLAAVLPGVLDPVDPASFAQAFTPHREITHRIDVRAHLAAKRAAMQAHSSQATSDVGPRTLALLLRLPAPAYGLVVGQEWFVQHGRRPGHCDDVFSGL